MVLEPGVLLTTTKSSYIQGFLYPGVLQLGGSYNQGFFNPRVLQPGVLTSRGLTTCGSYY